MLTDAVHYELPIIYANPMSLPTSTIFPKMEAMFWR